MRSLTFDEVFAMLSALALSASDLARLREWIAGIAHPGVHRPDRAGGQGTAVSALRPSEVAPLRPGQRTAALSLPRLRTQLQRADRHAACAVAQEGMLAALSAMRARIAHGARRGACRRRVSHDQFPVAPPLRARGDA